MDEKIFNQPSIGTWDKLPKEPMEKLPKVEFLVNIPQTVTFTINEPREYQGDNGAYYVFDVMHESQKKAIVTSAWSLLRTLKTLTPLKEKTVTITKKMEKGKQFFSVEIKK
jgi:LAS superfamily LD-carboxypeptidase LdcB